VGITSSVDYQTEPTKSFFLSDTGNSFFKRVNSDGTFGIALDPGTYSVRAKAYIENNHHSSSQVGTFAVVPDQTTSSVNLTLNSAPQITGSLVNVSGAAVSGVKVQVWPVDATGNFVSNSWFFGDDDQTDLTGNFQLGGLAPGNYKVIIRSPFGPIPDVSVTIDSTLSANPSTFPLTLGSINVNGSVKDATGNPITHFLLNVMNNTPNFPWGTELTSDTGSFQLILPDGEYSLSVYSGDEHMPSDPVTITVTNGVVSGNTNIVVKNRPWAEIYSLPNQGNPLPLVRYTGSDAINTNLAGIKAGWTVSDSAVFVSESDFADYPAALLITGHYNAPLFIVAQGGLSTEQLSELTALGVKQATLVGGTSVLSVSVESSLHTQNIAVMRVVGRDRYETMALANQLVMPSISGVNKLILAPGDDASLANTIALAGYAGKLGIPLLTTVPSMPVGAATIPDTVLNEIASLNPQEIFFATGVDKIGGDQEQQIKAKLGNPDNLLFRTLAPAVAGVKGDLQTNFDIISTLAYAWNLPNLNAHTVIAPAQSLSELATAANLAGSWDTIPLLSEANSPNPNIWWYLDRPQGSTTGASLPSPRASKSELDVIGSASLIPDNVALVYSQGGIMFGSTVPIDGHVLSGVTVTVNGVAQTVDATGNFYTSLNLVTGLNTITMVATRNGDTQTYTYYVINMTPPLTIPDIILPAATPGQAYTFPLPMMGGEGPYVWSAQNLPYWLSLDPATGLLNGTPTTTDVGVSTFTVYLRDSSGIVQQTSKQFTLTVQGTGTGPFAIGQVKTGLGPNGVAGIYLGIKNIVDAQGRAWTDQTLAGYQLAIDYDPTQVQLFNPNNFARLGTFTYNPASTTGTSTAGAANLATAVISDIGTTGTTNYQSLVFVPLVLTGPASSVSDITIRFEKISDADTNLTQIQPPPPMHLTFKKGRTANAIGLTPTRPLDIRDGIAGLQFLAGLRQVGVERTQVNPVNMASSLPVEQLVQPVQPGLANVVALMQYLAGLRDAGFQLISQH
jgi:hypothetical protein